MAKDKDFDYVREDIERYRKSVADKSVSLNEQKRLAEKAADKARVEARKKELAARHEAQPTAYEITLKLADQPGLPAPMTNKVVVAVNKADERTLKSEKAAAPFVIKTPPSPVAGEIVASPTETPAPVPKLDEDGESLEDTGVAADVPLKEAQHVLLDLIRLVTGKAGMAAKAP